MPTSRKPVARSNARLALFFWENARHEFPKAMFLRRREERFEGQAACASAPFLPSDINRKLGNALVTRPRPIRGSGSEGNDLAFVFYDHDRMGAIQPGVDVRGGSRFGLEGGAAVFETL